MKKLQSCWVTQFTSNTFTLTFKSFNADTDNRIYIKENTFPENPTEINPLKHTISINMLTQDDIDMLANLLDKWRTQ